MAIVNPVKKKLFDGDIDLVNDTIKVMLLTNAHTTNIDTQEFIDDVSANEVSGTGYTAGGATLAGKATTVDNTDDEGVFDANDVTWSNSTITARYAVVYKDTGTPGTSPIIAIIDFGSDQTSSNADFTIQWSSEGILNLN